MDSQHKRLLLHTDVRWLSRGKVLTRVHELRQELLAFFEAMKQLHFCDLLQCKFWIVKFGRYFSASQYFEHQYARERGNVLISTDKIKAFQKKLHVWKNTALKLV